MADFKGLKMRAPTRQTNKMLAALGATPVAMPLPALGDALSKGVVDGYLLPWEVIPSIKAHELTKYESETDPKVARALHRRVHAGDEPGEVRQPARGPQEGDRRQLRRSRWRARSASSGMPPRRPARKLAVDHGNTFYVIPASELENWQKATANLPDEWVKDVSAKGHDGKALLQAATDLIKKYEK